MYNSVEHGLVNHWEVAFMDLHKLSLLSEADGGPVTTINAIRSRISPLDCSPS